MKSKSISIMQHPILSKAWASDLNIGENPSLRGCRSNNSFNWRCLKCGKVFAAWPDTVANREGYCIECYKPIKMAKHLASMIQKNGCIADVPEIMALWHEDNPTPRSICKNSELKVKIWFFR